MSCVDAMDERKLRDALGLFPTGVAVAALRDADGTPLGVTVNSFSSVSLRPPLVSFCIARSLRSFAAFDAAGGFAVNLLTSAQAELSSRFARAGADKWAGVDFRPGLHGGLVIEEALASFDCRLYGKFDAGDHVILVGEVASLFAANAAESPLLYFRSGYRSLAEAA